MQQPTAGQSANVRTRPPGSHTEQKPFVANDISLDDDVPWHLPLLFEEGRTFIVENQWMTVSVNRSGEAVFPTGEVAVCDASFPDEMWGAFEPVVPAGTYAVDESIASTPGNGLPVGLRLMVSATTPVKWQRMRRTAPDTTWEQLPPHAVPASSLDYCLLDAALRAKLGAWYEEDDEEYFDHIGEVESMDAGWTDDETGATLFVHNLQNSSVRVYAGLDSEGAVAQVLLDTGWAIIPDDD